MQISGTPADPCDQTPSLASPIPGLTYLLGTASMVPEMSLGAGGQLLFTPTGEVQESLEMVVSLGFSTHLEHIYVVLSTKSYFIW